MLSLVGIGDVFIEVLEFRIRLNWQMWLVSPHGEKEGPLGVSFFLQPFNPLFHDERRRKAGEFTDGFTVANEVGRILMAGGSIVLGRQPPVVAVVVRLRMSWIVEVPIEMPLAHMTRAI